MRIAYLDTCAVVKLFVDEEESEALERWLTEQDPLHQITCHLTRTELRRLMQFANAAPDDHIRIDHWLQRSAIIALPAKIFDNAGVLTSQSRLRSLDALHVAAALGLGPALTYFVTYDKRLATAAEDHGLKVVSPS